MPVPNIPPELVNLVLLNLDVYTASEHHLCKESPHDIFQDKQDLDACTLVCRVWRLIAAAHLFCVCRYSFCYSLEDTGTPNELSVDESGVAKDSIVPISVTNASESLPRYKTIGHLVEFLSRHRALCQHIRVLTLAGYLTKPTYDANTVVRAVGRRLFVRLVGMLPRLDDLHLIDVGLSDESLESKAESDIYILRPFRLLTIRYPQNLGAYSQRDVKRMCELFTNIGTLLILTASDPHHPPPIEPDSTPLCLRARNFELIGPVEFRSLLVADIAQWPMVASLTTLTLRGVYIADPHILPVLQHAHALRDLTYLVMDSIPFTLAGEDIDPILTVAHSDPHRTAADFKCIREGAPLKSLQNLVLTDLLWSYDAPSWENLLRDVHKTLSDNGLTYKSLPALRSLSWRIDASTHIQPSDTLDYTQELQESISQLQGLGLDATLRSAAQQLRIPAILLETNAGPDVLEALEGIIPGMVRSCDSVEYRLGY